MLLFLVQMTSWPSLFSFSSMPLHANIHLIAKAKSYCWIEFNPLLKYVQAIQLLALSTCGCCSSQSCKREKEWEIRMLTNELERPINLDNKRDRFLCTCILSNFLILTPQCGSWVLWNSHLRILKYYTNSHRKKGCHASPDNIYECGFCNILS